MRIQTLEIENLRAIDRLRLEDLSDFVLIAGPNGCGKTTVLDAIRLLKSVYVEDEWKRWFPELGVNVDRPANWKTLFRNASREALISARLALSDSERAFLIERADNIALGLVLNESNQRKVTITGDPPLQAPSIESSDSAPTPQRAAELAKAIRDALEKGADFTAEVRLTPALGIRVTPSPIAAAAFSTFSPQQLGEVEFHTSRRLYARESVQSVRLNVGDRTEERRNRFLYDLENKYRNIKTQLGEEYVSAILQRRDPEQAPLQRSIKELFRTFFPGKEFLGVTAESDNSLSFPVRLSTGEIHDIDELSSGEKEIVYGYLWLRTGTPARSIVLVDEPELHLNPALVQGLPAFYKEHLSDALQAQVWIVTHSDGILRQAVRSPQMAVYHMARPTGEPRPQAVRIDGQNAVEAAVIDLIGDLAAYRPYARIVLLEGHKETRFDVDMVRRLFPELAERANFLPAGNRTTSFGVRARLSEVLIEVGLTGRTVSISDGDLGLASAPSGAGHFVWPVYEIENFLLHPPVLRAAATVFLRQDPYSSDHDVVADLRRAATPILDELALDEVQYLLNREFIACASIGGDRQRPVDGLEASAKAAQQRVMSLDYSRSRIDEMFNAAKQRLGQLLTSNEFIDRFPGDRLLRAFAGLHRINGDHFRNACLDQAQKLGHKPAGMEQTLQSALS